MIIIGDLAAPSKKHLSTIEEVLYKIGAGGDNSLVVNLEGLLSDEKHLNVKEPILYNCVEVVELLSKYNAKVVCLANNHTFDLVDKFDSTIQTLNDNNILITGASRNKEKIFEPIKIVEKGVEVFIFNLCWDFLIYNQLNPSNGVYLSILEHNKLLKQVEKYKKNNPSSKIMVYLHWSIDLEILPFPMDRRFAKELIDKGVDLVIGAHSHCIQGGEKYKNGHIIYGLGNFYIPHNTFANGKVEYPEFANKELVIDWDLINNSIECIWLDYKFNNSEHKLDIIGREKFESSDILKKYSPFQNKTTSEYITYFKKNRRKKTLMPLFSNYTGISYKLSLMYLKSRAKLARFLAKNNLLKWAK